MKRVKIISMLLSLVLLTFPIDAAESTTVDSTVAATTAGMTSGSGPENNSKSASGIILISAVTGAMIISALIYRVRDKGKYL